MKTKAENYLEIGKLNTIMKMVYENNDNSTEGLYLENREGNLLMVNTDYDPCQPLSSETLTIIIKDVVKHFGQDIRGIRISVSKKRRRYLLFPWPKKIISREYNIATKGGFERGGHLFIKPDSGVNIRELAHHGLLGHDDTGQVVIINPNLIGIKIKLD